VDIVRCLKNVWVVIKVDFFRYLSEMISIRQRKRKKKGADEEKVLRRKRVMLKLFFNTIKHAFRYDEGIKT
jgi:predicted RNA-binding protein with PUA-like domain